MGDWYDLDINCANCGKPLKARSLPNTKGYSIKGLRELEYWHEDGTVECVIRREPRPYDAWKATAAFEMAQRKAWDEEDARAALQEE